MGTVDYSLIFITGLLTSLHCLGMCGPIVLAYSAQSFGTDSKYSKAGALPVHLAYNAGRIISYTTIGAVAGAAGMVLGSLKMVGEYVSIIGGGLMIIAGLAMLHLIPIPRSMTSGKLSAAAGKIQGSLLKNPSPGSKLVLGLLTPLIPCGILYVMFTRAAATGDAIQGAATMFLFGIGMAPALIAMGSFSRLITMRMRRGAEILAGIMVILMGIILLLRGLHIPFLTIFTGGSGGHAGCH